MCNTQKFFGIGFCVATDIKGNVVDCYFLVWSLSRLLCCVCSVSNVAATLSGISPRFLPST